MQHDTNATTVDRELASVLICLAPLGDRVRSYLDTRSREFHADAMLDGGWSSGADFSTDWRAAVEA
jgi:hypothetical protein